MNNFNESIIQRIPTLLSAESEDEFIILNPDTNTIYSLNETAKEIWGYTDKKRTVQEIISHLSTIFDSTKEKLEKDLSDFLKEYSSILFEEVKNRP